MHSLAWSTSSSRASIHPSLKPARLRETLLATGFGKEHPGLVEHLLRALAPDPNERPAALTPWLSAFGAATALPSPVPPPFPPRRRHGRRLAAVALAAGSVAAAVALIVHAPDPGTPAAPRNAPAGASPPGEPAPADDIVVEMEDGTGDGNVMRRSEASNTRTLWLHDGEDVRVSFPVDTSATYELSLRYSNDNDDALPSEEVAIAVDGVPQAVIVAEDTGSGGAGWNVFRASSFATVPLSAGTHELVVEVRGGDGYGVEVDRVQVARR